MCEPDRQAPSQERRGAVPGGDRSARALSCRRRPRSRGPARSGHVLVSLPRAVPRRPGSDARRRPRPRRTSRPSEHTLEHEIVFAQLGGAAASIASEVESLGGVVTVTDGAGRILTVQGDKETLRRAREQQHGAVVVLVGVGDGHERDGHGARGARTGADQRARALVHGLRRVGLRRRRRSRRRDARPRRGPRRLDLARQPAAAGGRLAVQGGQRRARDPAPARPRQRRRAGRGVHPDAGAVRDRRSPPSTRAARSSSPTRTRACFLGVPARVPALDPAVRWQPGLDLGRLARHAIKQARLDHGWVGSTQIVTELSGEPCRITLRPVFLADQPIGTLALFGSGARRPDRARAARAARSALRRGSWA